MEVAPAISTHQTINGGVTNYKDLEDITSPNDKRRALSNAQGYEEARQEPKTRKDNSKAAGLITF